MKRVEENFNILELLTPKSITQYLGVKTTIRQALEKFDFHRFTVVPILSDEGEYLTTISEGDILRYIKNTSEFDMKKANSVRVLGLDHYRAYKAVRIDAAFSEVYELVLSQNFVPVMDDRRKFIGIIKRKAVLEYFAKFIED